jgi:hypothetical protein
MEFLLKHSQKSASHVRDSLPAKIVGILGSLPNITLTN